MNRATGAVGFGRMRVPRRPYPHPVPAPSSAVRATGPWRKGLLALLLFFGVAEASEVAVPEALRDWRAWVLQDKEYLNCPFFFDRHPGSGDDFICAWPGRLELTIDASGASFLQAWTLYAGEQWLPLPGDGTYWPHGVTVNDRPIEVVMRDGVPSLVLGPGSYRVAGRFEWDERPGVLAVPDRNGLVSLAIDGHRVLRPVRVETGIFLGAGDPAGREQDAVRTEVYRLVADDVPTRMVTVLFIDVSGQAREELFGPLLPEGLVPLAIDSDLPARLEADGSLRLQVRPGEWRVRVTARASGVLDAIVLAAPETNLPDSEIWSYRANDRLRVTHADGLPSVDPQQAAVPEEWRELPAFRIQRGQALAVTESSRGIGATGNQLYLHRDMWMAFDGSGFLTSDRIEGEMRRGWRLDMAPPYRLLSATEGGEELLVTRGAEAGQTGVELRFPATDVQALASVDTRGAMPVTGWNAAFTGARIRVNLPPGHKLLGAPGADQAKTSWASRWEVLDFFLVLIITVGAWRLFGRPAGIVALLALVLSYHEFDAPAWLWLNLLVAVALLRVAPPGRLRQSARVYQAVSAIALVLWLVPFVAGQVRIAVHPQLEPQALRLANVFTDAHEVRLSGLPPDSLEVAAPIESRRFEGADQRVTRGAPRAVEEAVAFATAERPDYARYLPNALVQTGPGIPAWRWNHHDLDWSGPVDAGQTLRLVVAPRWLVTVLRFLQVLLVLAFAAILAAEVLNRRLTLPGGWTLGRGGAAGGLLVAVLASWFGTPPAAQAELPDAALLAELEKRLLEPPGCAPRCAEIAAAEVDVAAAGVRMQLSVHALAHVALPLPGTESGWRPETVLVDGAAAAPVFRTPGPVLWVSVPPGRHQLLLSGALPAIDGLEIPFPAPPRVLRARAEGWSITGIKDRRLLSGSLQLTRVPTAAGAEPALARWESSRFPPFVHIDRTLELGLDWGAKTTVTRIAPVEGTIALDVPLLAGESVVAATEGLTAGDAVMPVSMGPAVQSVFWESYLPGGSPMVIESAPGQPWRELWRIAVDGMWHAEISGVPESLKTDGLANRYIAEYHPRAGESLTLDATRPEASPGQTLAFDSAELLVVYGSRSSDARLVLDYRSTRGAQHGIRLPENAVLTGVLIDGLPQPLRAEGGLLNLPILPGEHSVSLNWRGGGSALRTTTPVVDLGAPVGNINLGLKLPASRWLLATRGPPLGPAVLYWVELIALVLFALILGRTRLTPLNGGHWLLLGIGLSTYSWPVLGIVAAWLLLCGARERWRADLSRWRYNGVQAAIAAMTVLALTAVVVTLPVGLLGTPDMQVAGHISQQGVLQWFADRSASVLPVATVWSVPLWIYKALILAWALWLSFVLLRWLPWVWRCFSAEGLWRGPESRQPG